ncbi:MAG: universal stress protein [Candidatus Promineifilaceae bacterium]|nr:universal stress protein [Candidatus Promineifilaceae bacterium]
MTEDVAKGTIVCATRGGQGSRAVQLAAIDRAKETDERLIFLYVVDLPLIEEYDEALTGAMRAEFQWLGEALLRVAQQRAERERVDAEIAIREGGVKEEIETFLRESDASVLMLGAPRGTTPNVFGDDAIERFARTIESDTGVAVKIVRP